MIEKIHIVNEKELDYRLTSSVDDNTFDLEIWHGNICLLVFHIQEDYSIKVHFGKVDAYSIDNKLLKNITLKAEARLVSKLKDWLDSKLEY